MTDLNDQINKIRGEMVENKRQLDTLYSQNSDNLENFQQDVLSPQTLKEIYNELFEENIAKFTNATQKREYLDKVKELNFSYRVVIDAFIPIVTSLRNITTPRQKQIITGYAKNKKLKDKIQELQTSILDTHRQNIEQYNKIVILDKEIGFNWIESIKDGPRGNVKKIEKDEEFIEIERDVYSLREEMKQEFINTKQRLGLI